MSLEPTLAEVIEGAIESKLLDVHTACPGRVVKYDAKKQVADIELVVNRPLEVYDGSFEQEKLPILPNVPVKWLRAGGFSFHMPLAVDDHVLVIFSESSIAMWRSTGEKGDVGDTRRHSLGHAIAIPGLASESDPIAEDDAPAENEMAINGPDGKIIRLGKSAAAQFVALSNLVDARIAALVSFINSHVHPTGVGPSGAVASPLATQATVAAVKVKAE